MRERVAKTDGAQAGARRPAADASGGLTPLLALQRSAGNAAVVAMLGRDEEPRESSTTDAPIRRLWDKSTMNAEAFEDLILGTGVVRDHIHDRIQDHLDEYLEAVEIDDWVGADSALDVAMLEAQHYLSTNPPRKVAAGVGKFLEACKKEKKELRPWLDQVSRHGIPRPLPRATPAGPQSGSHPLMAGALAAHDAQTPARGTPMRDLTAAQHAAVTGADPAQQPATPSSTAATPRPTGGDAAASGSMQLRDALGMGPRRPVVEVTQQMIDDLGMGNLLDLRRRYPGGNPPLWLQWFVTGGPAGAWPYPEGAPPPPDDQFDWRDPRQRWMEMDEDERRAHYYDSAQVEAAKLTAPTDGADEDIDLDALVADQPGAPTISPEELRELLDGLGSPQGQQFDLAGGLDPAELAELLGEPADQDERESGESELDEASEHGPTANPFARDRR